MLYIYIYTYIHICINTRWKEFPSDFVWMRSFFEVKSSGAEEPVAMNVAPATSKQKNNRFSSVWLAVGDAKSFRQIVGGFVFFEGEELGSRGARSHECCPRHAPPPKLSSV